MSSRHFVGPSGCFVSIEPYKPSTVLLVLSLLAQGPRQTLVDLWPRLFVVLSLPTPSEWVDLAHMLGGPPWLVCAMVSRNHVLAIQGSQFFVKP